MSATTDFIAELFRAANDERLKAVEKKRLLERAVVTIRDMREQVGIEPSKSKADAVIDLQTVAGSIPLGKASSEEVKTALLDAAEMIRTLKIVLDAKGEVLRGE